MNFYVVFTLLVGTVLLLRLKNKRIGLFLLLLLLFLSAFRGDKVGNDTMNNMDYQYMLSRAAYVDDLKHLEISDLGGQVEIVSGLMYKFILNHNLNPRWIIYFYSVLMFVFLALAFKRFKVNTAYALVVYVILGFFYYSLTAARQLAAVSVLLYAFSFLYYEKRRIGLFVVWVLFATTIHSFSLIGFVALPILFIPYLNNKVVFVLYIFASLLLVIKIDFINQLSLALDIEHLSTYYENYHTSETLSVKGVIFNWLYISFLFYYYYKNSKLPNGNKTCFIGNFYLFSIVVYAAVVNYGGIISRVQYDTSIIQCVLIADYYSRISSNKELRKKENLVFLAFLILCTWQNKGFLQSLTSNYYLMF